jgi:hypothetical protein
VARPDLRTFLERSFVVLAHEAPGAYARLHRSFARIALCVVDGDRRFAVRCDPDRIMTDLVRGDEDIVTAIDSPTILALVDGELTFEQALRQDRLFVLGAVGQAASAFEALSIYLRGAIRCPSFPALLASFRSSISHEYQP